MTRIYTRSGDKGETGVYGGRRVRKNDLRIRALGAIDELNAALGVCRSFCEKENTGRALEKIQRKLIKLGSDVATPADAPFKVTRLSQKDVDEIEREIDEIEKRLAPLTVFILPAGGKSSSLLHYARAVCRTAEREAVALAETQAANPHALAFLNRLSDLLFVLARSESGKEEKC